MALKTVNIDSLSKFTEVIEGYDDRRWYRGVGDTNHKLLPSLYRHPKIKDADELLKNEFEILKRFEQRSLPFVNSIISSNSRMSSPWEQLFIMQHFGVPTRLLDWSESPYVALFFALTSAKYAMDSSGNRTYSTDACVWILKPEQWNATALSYVDPTPGILTPDVDDHLNGYIPTSQYKSKRHVAPVAIHGSYNSMRIVNQRGAFILFGKGLDPMEDVYVTGGYPEDCLMKINISSDKIDLILSKVSQMGLTDSVIYPDLTGLAMELKRLFQFQV